LQNQIDELNAHYLSFYPELLKDRLGKRKAKVIIQEHFVEFLNYYASKSSFNEAINRDILAPGELLCLPTKVYFKKTLFREF